MSGSPSVLEIVAEMRTIARVAGQCSVEGQEDEKSLMAAAESDRCTRWADALEAALRAGASEEETPKLETCAQCGGILPSRQFRGSDTTCVSCEREQDAPAPVPERRDPLRPTVYGVERPDDHAETFDTILTLNRDNWRIDPHAALTLIEMFAQQVRARIPSVHEMRQGVKSAALGSAPARPAQAGEES